ncbi:MAG: major capsid family protein, partial [Bradymonadaceae bacterium]
MRYSQWKLDAGEFPNPDLAAFAERELEAVREEVLQKKLPPLSGRELIPQNMDLESWKERYVHQMYELLGTAEFAGDATEDFPLVDVSKSEETFNIRKIGCAYKHTIDEMEKSQALGRGLDEKRASAARRATNEKLNEIMWYGDQREQLFGLVNYPDSPHVVLAQPIDDTTAADVIKNMLTDLLVSIFSSTRQSAKPDQIWMA